MDEHHSLAQSSSLGSSELLLGARLLLPCVSCSTLKADITCNCDTRSSRNHRAVDEPERFHRDPCCRWGGAALCCHDDQAPQDTTGSSEWIRQLTFTHKHLSVTRDLSGRHTFQPVPCLFSLLQSTQPTQPLPFLTLPYRNLLLRWVWFLQRTGSLDGCPHLTDLGDYDLSVSFVEQGEQSAMFDVKGKPPCSV